ncbi:MAG: NAD(P)H-dependent oxidoreductase subunit E [Firmicutes bacterium]|nr:NAD(P)H-dependent oxidoreductase subunit E [Bacillota bacterium]MDD7603075.1 NAD(P)H-dependent oxidoreductase subunit E [Bacillota bacterium]MDY5856387.1 NAD(P)H-dependent oxidoreductase subunit E [Anaerovoracaceae bacterium]
MAKKKTVVPFQGTAEQEARLKAVIDSYRDIPGALMPVLQQAQEIYGYLPVEVQKMIAEGLNVPLAEVYGVSTFYSQFTLNPKGKNEVSVCLGTACYVKGAGAVLDKVCETLGIEPGSVTPDGEFSVSTTRCIGACGLAPVMTINDEVYGQVTKDDVSAILGKYLK